MWTRSQLKEKGKKSFKANYWKAVLVALLLTLVIGGGPIINLGFNGDDLFDSPSPVHYGNVTVNGNVTVDDDDDDDDIVTLHGDDGSAAQFGDDGIVIRDSNGTVVQLGDDGIVVHQGEKIRLVHHVEEVHVFRIGHPVNDDEKVVAGLALNGDELLAGGVSFAVCAGEVEIVDQGQIAAWGKGGDQPAEQIIQR